MHTDVTIFIIELTRRIRSFARSRLAPLAFGLLMIWPASAGAAEGPAGEREGLPFSIVDLGWITFALAILILLALILRAVARHRSRLVLRSFSGRRTDP